MSRQPSVLLFDIDGTLLTTGGAGGRAMGRAFASLHGRPDALDAFSLSGMTDRAIVRKALTLIGEEVSERAIDALMAAYLRFLAEEVHKTPAADYYLHPGMREAVEAACARERFAVGLGTGNVREGARVKLLRVGIYERFAFGGFGCDHEDRVALIRCGAERGAERLGVPYSECRVVVIGDTPKDIDAARANGALSVGVATGPFTTRELEEAGADLVFPHLDSPAALHALLEGP